ncbi:hypothetical protein V6N13_072250 [Hibiscus sabdariffa]|uniref:RRM domain-containing protein n=1 Tax=Hibiscus sabdariffa TaxID=183260 RepID=A0ABR2R821_9ROSI
MVKTTMTSFVENRQKCITFMWNGCQFGFVRMKSKRDARVAVERLNGFRLYGSVINVLEAKHSVRSTFWKRILTLTKGSTPFHVQLIKDRSQGVKGSPSLHVESIGE